ncbi:MAG: hypothetical protein RBS80_24975 [Thermoguttaceae bacterium]|jgi:hypothetical protein|nr:hypothetical protein [Thermoguttaceae bacterium]
MKRLGKAALVFAALIAIGLSLDYLNVARKERQLSTAVSNCGGRIGSIPVWPLGTEYRITLTKVPDDDELRQLGVANRMRGWVGIAFRECEINGKDQARLRSGLPNCHLFVIRNDTMTPVGHTEESLDAPERAPEP